MAIAELLAAVAPSEDRSGLLVVSLVRWKPLYCARFVECAVLEVLTNYATFHRVWHACALFLLGEGSPCLVVGLLGRFAFERRFVDDLGERVIGLDHFLDRFGD